MKENELSVPVAALCRVIGTVALPHCAAAPFTNAADAQPFLTALR